MSADDEWERLLAYLGAELPPEQERELQARLRDDPALRERLLALALDECVLGEWAVSRRHAREIEEAAWEEDVPGEGERPGALGWWPRGLAALVTAAFLLVPPGAVALAAYLGGDGGLGLSGWADSMGTLLRRAALVVAALLAVSWLCARRYGGVRHPALCGLGGAATLLTATVAGQLAVASYAEGELARSEEMIQSHLWISYDSAYYWPQDLEQATGRPAREPTPDQVREELTVLREAGFTGLFVHECRDGQVCVPRIARDVGFTAVVQGIRVADPRNLDAPETRRQIDNAVAVQDFVDAYCLGELSAREVSLPGLKKELTRLRRLTGRPATASFLNNDDLGTRGARLRDLEDFTMRALARPWEDDRGDPDEAIRAVKAALDAFRQDDRPALLTTVFYPSGGGPAFSEERQERFFRGVCELTPPRGVHLVFFNSFDRPWARKRSELDPKMPRYEGYTGLFSAEPAEDGEAIRLTPKKALAAFRP